MNIVEWLGYMGKAIEIETEVLKKFRKLYNEKRASQQCLWRDDETVASCDCKRVKGRRGLCMKHYRAWLRARLQTPKNKLVSFEAFLVQTAQIEKDIHGERTDLERPQATAVPA